MFKIKGLLGMLTMWLRDNNFAKSSFQFRFVLEGYDLFDFFDGTNVCTPKYVISLDEGINKELTTSYCEWVKTDKVLLSLLIATLGHEAIEYVAGSRLFMKHGLISLIDMLQFQKQESIILKLNCIQSRKVLSLLRSIC